MKKNLDNISSSAEMKQNELVGEIDKLCDGLIYISETDAEIESFAGKRTEAVTSDVMRAQANADENTVIEEISFDDFFSRLTKINDWFGEREKKQAGKFTELKKLLEENLSGLKVFKVGRIRLDIYVVGLDCDQRLTGIKTKAVET